MKLRNYLLSLILLLMLSTFAIAQKAKKDTQKNTVTVHGVITTEKGRPLPGATVIIKGTTRGKASDINGTYSIRVAPKETLVFSYIGYNSVSRKTSIDTNEFNVSLEVSNRFKNKKENLLKLAEVNRQRTKNYFAFQKKKRKEECESRRARRAKRKAEKKAKRALEKN